MGELKSQALELSNHKTQRSCDVHSETDELLEAGRILESKLLEESTTTTTTILSTATLVKDPKEPKQLKEPKDAKDHKDPKDPKEVKESEGAKTGSIQLVPAI